MDVSRINALTPAPRHVDWRKLTANEIIKYEKEGTQVPEQYLQWAKEFLQDVSAQDKDDTTYEMATAVTGANPNVSGKTNTLSEENPTGQTTKELTAKEKREQMEKDGTSTLDMAKTFRNESKERTQDSISGANLTSNISQSSEGEIQTVEGDMQELLARADEIKGKITTEKSKKDKTSNIGRILELQNQLKRVGQEAQGILANSENDFNDYQAIIDIQAPIGTTTEEYGTETVEIGKQLQEYPIINHIGRHTESVGNRAIDAGENHYRTATTASETNTSNLDKILAHKNEVHAKTGVAEAKPNKQEENSTNKKDPANSAGITETDKAASANLDQVLLAKIRRGENPNG